VKVKKKKKKKNQRVVIHVGGLNLKEGLGKLTNPKRRKSKCTCCLIKNKKEEEEAAAAATMDTTSPCEPKASPDKFEKIERKSK
jgi:hypothetical protein